MPTRGGARAASHWPRVRTLVRPFRGRLVALAAASFGAGASEALFLVIVTRVGLSVADGKDETGLVAGWSVSMGEAIAIGLGLIALRLVLGLVVASLSTGLTAAVRSDLRHRLSDAYLGASWAVQQAEPSGRLAQLLTAFTNESVGAVTSLATMLAAAFSLTALLGGAVLVDAPSTVVAVVALVVLGSVLAPLRRRIKLRSTSAATAQLSFASAVSELGALGLEMQTYGVRDQFAEQIGALIEREVRARRRAELLRTALPVVYTSMAYVAVLAGLGLAGVGDGDLAELGAVMLVLLRSLTYGQQLQVASASLLQSMPFLERLDETLAGYDADRATGGSARPGSVGAIELRDVTFGYDPERPVLHGLSLRIEAGETVGVIGPSGAGKSTLVQLLLGVRDPSEGTLLVGGHDLRDIDRGWWSTWTAFVAQDALLFTGTVAENIRFFRNGISDEQVRQAAAEAHVLADIDALPDGFDTHLGERGSQLSGGQRQRVSIARALAGRPGLLILDEPTSALDVRSEALIRQTLAELHGERTLVVIAHRLSTLDMCDRILVIEGGRLTAEGPPAELREHNEFYRHALELSGHA
jgi:ABC-type multidrug transport system fused ATPase/permease subunit